VVEVASRQHMVDCHDGDVQKIGIVDFIQPITSFRSRLSLAYWNLTVHLEEHTEHEQG
jgi:hypothetical protein